MAELLLGANGRYTTIIDDKNYPVISRWRWQYKLSAQRRNQKVYAKRTTRIKGRKVTILLSHFVLKNAGKPRPHGYDAGHLNGNSLDNREENLEWQTKRRNRGWRKEK
jgi:HNH endonuclease